MKKRKYLEPTPQDYEWGLAIKSIGYEELPVESDPTSNNGYYEVSKSRTLDCFQLMYIVDGEGIFTSQHCPKTKLKKGDVFILFPHEWHSYHPAYNTGWKAYWIWFNGETMLQKLEKGFFSYDKPIYHIGICDIVTRLYNDAYETALQDGLYSQQRLAGIVSYLLGLIGPLEYDRANSKNRRSDDIINKALSIISENLEGDMTIQDIAEQLCTSYNYFRKLFKQHTGISPAIYQQNQKISRAKELLSYSQLSIKEIAFRLNFDFNYFCLKFRNITGYTPKQYRERF